MNRDCRAFLWTLKLGALINLVWIFGLIGLERFDLHAVVPGFILLSVSAFRCLFPNRYGGNVVFHDTPLSGILVARCLATFAEVAFVYQLSYALQILNESRMVWIDVLAWLMVAQGLASQICVWIAILTKRARFYFYEEFGWLLIFVANTIASAYLALHGTSTPGETTLLTVSLIYGAGYLPWQILHLRSLVVEERSQNEEPVGWREGFRAALHLRHPTTNLTSWGGWVGLTWLFGYFATVIPWWAYTLAVVVSTR